jgi:hypothetical protein
MMMKLSYDDREYYYKQATGWSRSLDITHCR